MTGDNSRYTRLRLASQSYSGRLDVSRPLVEHGANINAEGNIHEYASVVGKPI